MDSDGVSPRIEQLRFQGQAPDSDLVLLFASRFTDPDGDLGRGYLETFLNERPSGLGQLPLQSLFLQKGLPLDANEGTFSFALELAVAEAPAGTTPFRLGVRLVDAAGNNSQTEEVALELGPRETP
ncbi:MAG: hypothetical protein ACO3JL_19155 [Myxococcota bacterium]